MLAAKDREETADIMTASGQYFDFVSPWVSKFTVDDIAHALANLCRFNGHCREFYSVAQHSVLVSEIVPPGDAFAGLVHDTAEAFLGDVTKPLKRLLPDYQAVERRVEEVVFASFGLPARLPLSVKMADMILLSTEQRDLMPRQDKWKCINGIKPMIKRIVPLPPKEAKALFLARFRELQSGAAK